jgi:hypothetical protein
MLPSGFTPLPGWAERSKRPGRKKELLFRIDYGKAYREAKRLAGKG